MHVPVYYLVLFCDFFGLYGIYIYYVVSVCDPFDLHGGNSS